MTQPNAFDAALYRVLAYCNACMEAGADPDVEGLRKVSGVNPTYFDRVMRSAIEGGCVSGFSYAPSINSVRDSLVSEPGCGITRKGAASLSDDPAMVSVRKRLGDAFQTVLVGLAEAAAQKAMGL